MTPASEWKSLLNCIYSDKKLYRSRLPLERAGVKGESMKTEKWLIIIVVALLTLAACSNSRVKMDFPKWWELQNDKDNICTYGMATKASQTLSIEAARANALAEASRYVETQVRSMLKNYEEEAGVTNPQVLALTQNVVKVVSEAKFSGILTGQMEVFKETIARDVRYTTYIQMRYPKWKFQKTLSKTSAMKKPFIISSRLLRPLWSWKRSLATKPDALALDPNLNTT